jgi:hypothetical protein
MHFFRLAADGLSRTYQIEMTALPWTWPKELKWLVQQETLVKGQQQRYPWLDVLVPNGPYLVDRLISARELPDDMDTEGKASHIREALRRTALGADGVLDVDLHSKLCGRTLMWASDGADRQVGMAVTVFCPNMVFREWDECHSAVKSLPRSVEAVAEANTLDTLLVSGRDPPSLAKFISTSDVFCKRFGHAVQQESVTYCKSFSWAMQRYTSRVRPLTKMSRRFVPVFTAVAAEASSNSARREIALHLMRELTGANSHRLILAGMLTDISVEHYRWVSGGDILNPDPSGATERDSVF